MADIAYGGRLKSSWGWLALLAVISIVGGLLALFNPFAATLAATLMAGWAFAILGAVQIVQSFQVRGWGGFLWALLLGVLALIVGISLIANPLEGMISLTLLVAVLFLVTGVIKIVFSFSLRPIWGWGWVLASGIVSLVLGIMILAEFPWSARSVLGILLGVELLSNGILYLLIALGLRKLA